MPTHRVSPAGTDPHEKEILFPPLLGIEALDTYVDGQSLIIDARLSLNLNALTLEEVVFKRQKLVRDMCAAFLLPALAVVP